MGHCQREDDAVVSRVIVTDGAARGLARCRQFLIPKAPEAVQRAGEVVARHLLLLETTPEMGRPSTADPGLRELVIPFGDSGYVALYRHESAEDTSYILAFRHQKEAGY